MVGHDEKDGFRACEAGDSGLEIEAEWITGTCLIKILAEGLTENPLSPAHAGSQSFLAYLPHAHA
jgi:hypothetical protein